LPVGSNKIVCSGVRTIRVRRRLSVLARQITQVRCGMGRGRVGCVFFAPMVT
jgi:hypothetical protein